MIEVNNVHKKFNQKVVLKGIHLKISKGEIFGLLGPSGAGKTTLIKILTGQLEFEEGSVKILNKSVKELTGEDRKKLGIMMEQFGLCDRFSCMDNLKIFAEIYRIPYNKVKESLSMVGLEAAAKIPACKLSKGMRSRLQLARVFMHTPQIIFLDEPTSGLDPATSRAIHQMIIAKKEEGCTIFLTTHDMEEATKLCDHVALLNEGKIVEYGSPQEICTKYNHQKRIRLRLYDGRNLDFTHAKDSASEIYSLLLKEQVETIHSSEPNLETVFLELTGRCLQDNE